eukprot:TRINITY_DN47246_c0_g2_i1.p1 TRINITY_DN47246_c0_g2~~TRINITY_DN47246_c0_g2_i1.p1  ORF type:complete len:714 (-),score=123.96 TRINITY_DN47246_c0_g2_i1:55-2196(-)
MAPLVSRSSVRISDAESFLETAKFGTSASSSARADPKTKCAAAALPPPPPLRGTLLLERHFVKSMPALNQRYQLRYVSVEGAKLYWWASADEAELVGLEGCRGSVDFVTNPCIVEADRRDSTKLILRPTTGSAWVGSSFAGAQQGRTLRFDVSGTELELPHWLACMRAHVSHGEVCRGLAQRDKTGPEKVGSKALRHALLSSITADCQALLAEGGRSTPLETSLPAADRAPALPARGASKSVEEPEPELGTKNSASPRSRCDAAPVAGSPALQGDSQPLIASPVSPELRSDSLIVSMEHASKEFAFFGDCDKQLNTPPTCASSGRGRARDRSCDSSSSDTAAPTLDSPAITSYAGSPDKARRLADLSPPQRQGAPILLRSRSLRRNLPLLPLQSNTGYRDASLSSEGRLRKAQDMVASMLTPKGSSPDSPYFPPPLPTLEVPPPLPNMERLPSFGSPTEDLLASEAFEDESPLSPNEASTKLGDSLLLTASCLQEPLCSLKATDDTAPEAISDASTSATSPDRTCRSLEEAPPSPDLSAAQDFLMAMLTPRSAAAQKVRRSRSGRITPRSQRRSPFGGLKTADAKTGRDCFGLSLSDGSVPGELLSPKATESPAKPIPSPTQPSTGCWAPASAETAKEHVKSRGSLAPPVANRGRRRWGSPSPTPPETDSRVGTQAQSAASFSAPSRSPCAAAPALDPLAPKLKPLNGCMPWL